jgi:prophage regulatory protein
MSQANLKSPRILRVSEVMERLSLSKASIYRLAKDGLLPLPIKLGERATGWIESEINASIEARMAARDGRK